MFALSTPDRLPVLLKIISPLLPPSSPSHLPRKDQKKVDKLTAQIPYHEGRGNLEEVAKIKERVDSIWEKAREAQWA